MITDVNNHLTANIRININIMLNKAGYEDRQLYRCQEFLLTY